MTDLKLMADNAALYSGAGNPVAKDGKHLFELGTELVNGKKKAFEVYETDVKAK